MIRPEFHLLWTGAVSVLALLGIGSLPPADTARGARVGGDGSATVMASYVETPNPGLAEGASTNEIRPEADGLYYVEARFSDGRRLRFLVDTGASVTVLTGRDAKLLNVGVGSGEPAARLRTAGGAMVARSGTIGDMEIAGRRLRDIDVAIIDNGLPVSLLGQNALSELGAITLDKGRMIIH